MGLLCLTWIPAVWSVIASLPEYSFEVVGAPRSVPLDWLLGWFIWVVILTVWMELIGRLGGVLARGERPHPWS